MRTLIIIGVFITSTYTSYSQNCKAIINMPGNHNFVIPTCQESIIAAFSFSIHDPCDQPIDVNSANFYIGGDEIFPSFINANSGYFEFTETLTIGNDGDLFLVTYTDTSGTFTATDALIQVEQMVSEESRFLMPHNSTFYIPACKDSILVTFSIDVLDLCDDIINGSVEFFVGTAQIFPTSIESDRFHFSQYLKPQDDGLELAAVYNGDTTAVTLTIIKKPDPEFAAGCLSEVNIPLVKSCRQIVNYKQLLVGCLGCYEKEDVLITIHDSKPGNGIIDEPGSFAYDLEIRDEQFNCSGLVHAIGFGDQINCNDLDKDGIPDHLDNCPTIQNQDQRDSNNNGIGDACEKIAGSDAFRLDNAAGDIYVENNARGLILKASNDQCFRVTIDPIGRLKKTPIACP